MSIFYAKITLLIVAFATTLFCGVEVSATSASPWIYRVERVSSEPAPLLNWQEFLPCSGRYESIALMNGERHRACVYGSYSTLRYASYININGGVESAVSLKASSVFTPVNFCKKWGCLYSAKPDTLFVPTTSGLEVYRGVSHRLQTYIQLDGWPRYTFATQGVVNIATTPSSSPGPLRPIDAVLSNNQEWLAVEYGRSGYALVDATYLVVKKVYHMGDGWSLPRMSMAVTNDGVTIALLGSALESSAIPTSYCDETETGLEPNACSRSILSQAAVPTGQLSAKAARFSDDGRLLTYRAQFEKGLERIVTLRATLLRHEATGAVDYVALGDSFSSGEGESTDGWYVSGTNDEFEKCHVSGRAYPLLLGMRWGLRTKSVACSGARFRDLLRSNDYTGQGDRLGAKKKALPEAQLIASQEEALDSFVPGRIAQLSFIEKYKPRLISVGIGGNDAGFAAKLTACIMPGTCEWAASQAWRSKVAKEIRALFDQYVELFRALKLASPDSRIFALGYPSIVSDAWLCPSYIGLMYDPDERLYISNATRYVNDVMQSAATSEGLKFIDIWSVYDGGRLCDHPHPLAMNGIRLGDDIAMGGVLKSMPLIGSESFHPTPIGHGLVAARVFSNYSGADDFMVIQPQALDVTAPPAPGYWGAEDEINSASQIKAEAFLDNSDVKPGQPITIELPDGSFMSRAEIFVEIYSEPRELWRGSADARGAVTVDIDAPSYLAGYHTVIVRGVDESGEEIEYYDTLYIGDNTPVGSGGLAENESGASGADLITSGPSNNGQTLAASKAKPANSSAANAVNYEAVLGVDSKSPAPADNKLILSLVAALLLIVAACYVCVGFTPRRGYNGGMNIRKIVKALIPRGLFRRIEPAGHLLEAVIENVRYGFPSRKLKVIGVTGTNGKTTTSFMIHKMLHEAGVKVALMTTVGYGVGDDITPQMVHMTTTQAGILQRRLRDFARAGAEWVVVETSSHALAQHRVWGLNYEIAVMTNVTHDHLDYHGTFINYVLAKRRLFKIANRHGRRLGVVNANDPSAKLFAKSIKRSVRYGIDKGDLRASNLDLRSDGSSFTAVIGAQKYSMKVNIPGEFNVSNALAAMAVGRELGLNEEQIEKGIAALKSVEGRMNIIDEGQKFKVIVDFASSPDGFEKFFSTTRPLVKGKLIAVFGSAGRRDVSKRAIQGKIAGGYADIVVITEEDDRDEDGARILSQIAAGAKEAGKTEGTTLFIEPSREKAIGFAMTLASSPNDTVVLLGKGHEKTIERADGEYPWSDTEVARTALGELVIESSKGKRKN